VERAEKMVVSFPSYFPGVARLSGSRNFHGFRKAGRARRHSFLEIWPIMGEPVFTFGARLGEFCGFTIALEAQA
jgi:hypothetical protein